MIKSDRGKNKGQQHSLIEFYCCVYGHLGYRTQGSVVNANVWTWLPHSGASHTVTRESVIGAVQLTGLTSLSKWTGHV
jgi:hypothetical protein